MARSVKVLLEAQTRDYQAEVKAAAKATDDLGEELAEVAAKGEGVTVVAGRASEAVDDLGESARRAARHVDKLDSEIAKAKQDLVFLSAQFADANEASRADLTKGITALERKLRDLEKNKGILKALIPKPEEAAAAGAQIAQEVTSAATKSIGVKPIAIAAAVAIGAAIAPILGPAIGGAIVGGVGLGGIIGGVALAANHPEVAKRGAQLGKAYFAGLKGEAQDAFAQPIMDALDQVDEWAGSALPRVGEFFDNVAPGLDHFVESLINVGDALLDSFVYSSERAEEPMRALGDLVETTGVAIADMITTLSNYSQEGANALDDLAGVIEGTIGTVTDFLVLLANLRRMYDSVMGRVSDGLSQLQEPSYDGWIGLASAQGAAAAAAVALSEDTEKLGREQSAAARAADGHREALVELTAEMKAETDPVFGLLDAQKDLAEAQKAVAKATKEHGENSAEAQSALRDLATAAIDLQGKAGELGETFDGRLSPSLRATLRSANLTDAQIDRLEKQFRDARGSAEGFAKNWRANISIPGLVKSTSDVRELRRQVEQLRSKTINVRVRVSQQGEILYGGQVGAYAEGGAIEGPGTGTSDSVPIMASAGEHMWTAAEVQAAGGHHAVEQMRAAVLAGGNRSTTQVMPASAAQRMVVEVRGDIDLSRADATAFGQLLASTLRTKSAIRQEVKTLLNQS